MEIKAITFTVIMRWVKDRQLWLMLRALNQKMIQEFFDCENIGKAFPCLDRSKDNFYDITIHRIERKEQT